jgi:integrase
MTPWNYTTADGSVTVEERVARNRVLYLWWRDAGNWRKKSLSRGCRGDRGALMADVVQWAKEQADKKAAELMLSIGKVDGSPKKPLTLEGSAAVLVDTTRGKYPHDTPHRRELLRALTFAVSVVGGSKTWDSFDVDDYKAVWRSKIQQALRSTKATHSTAKGHGAALSIVKSLVAIASALREGKRIQHSSAHPPKKWREQIAVDWQGFANSDRPPKRFQPRHTPDEMLKLLRECDRVDPRFGLLLYLGAELRLGQVARARRSDLKVDGSLLETPGSGKKEGAKVDLTDGMVRKLSHAFDTWLSTLERRYQADGVDYYLFPAGRAVHKIGGNWDPKSLDGQEPVSREWVLKHFHLCEDAAGVRRLKGRGAYGVKRQAVDKALEEGISDDAVMNLGGWTSSRMPREVYRDKQIRHGAKEARAQRARIRGESKEQ